MTEAVFSFYRSGNWTVETVSAATTDLSGTVSVVLGSLTLSGFAKRHGTFADTQSVRVVGGAGGLATPCMPKQYQNLPMRFLLRDLMQTAGETLSSTVSNDILNIELSDYILSNRPVATVLTQLLQYMPEGTVWRVLVDGTIWFGLDTYPANSTPTQLIDYSPRELRYFLGVDDPVLLPGQSIVAPDTDGNSGATLNIDIVETRVKGDEIRSRVWFVDP